MTDPAVTYYLKEIAATLIRQTQLQQQHLKIMERIVTVLERSAASPPHTDPDPNDG